MSATPAMTDAWTMPAEPPLYMPAVNFVGSNMNQITLPIPVPLDQQCAEAKKRIQEHINRSSGQHKRFIRRAFVYALGATS